MRSIPDFSVRPDPSTCSGQGTQSVSKGLFVVTTYDSENPSIPQGERGWTQADSRTISLLIGGKVAGVVAASDAVKPTSKRAIEAMQELGLEVVMITGDNKQTADIIAKELGITRVFAEVLPADKADYVKQLQSEGKFTAMATLTAASRPHCFSPSMTLKAPPSQSLPPGYFAAST